MKKNQIPLIDALNKIKGTGRFHSTGEKPFVFPGLKLPSGEELSFPLPRVQAKAIKKEADPAPYGKGEKTLLDKKVRKCWQIDASELTFKNSAWNKLIKNIVKSVAEDLGVEAKIVAEPYKLLLYEKGGFFLPHRDTEKLSAMFATLIVALPSAHKGGHLVIRHDDREERVDFSSEDRRGEIQYAAFFADCEHEIKPVTSGNRLCLTYNLALKKGASANLNLPSSEHSVRLIPHLKTLRKTNPDDLSVILLEHRYTKANLSVSGLKGHDCARATALFEAAEKAGFVAHLILLTLHQSGELADDYSDFYERYVDPDDSSMGEIHEETLSIDHWRDSSDRKKKFGSYEIDASRIISDEGITKGEPDEKEAEGFTGNAGCTMDYWYRHAAIVLWPNEAKEAVLVNYNFEETVKKLLKLASKKGASENASFLKLGRASIARAEANLANCKDYERQGFISNSLPILDAICTSACKELFDQCRQNLLPHLLKVSDSGLWKKIHSAFEHETSILFLEEIDSENLLAWRDSLLSSLSAMLREKTLPRAVAAAYANKSPDWLEIPAEKPLSYRYRKDSIDLSPELRLHIAICASFLIHEAGRRKKLFQIASGNSELPYLREVLAPALKLKTHRRHSGEPDSLFPKLLNAARKRLEEEVALPLVPYPNWTRPFPSQSEIEGDINKLFGFTKQSTRDKGLIDELKSFMADPETEIQHFKCAQRDRDSIGDFIVKHNIDLDSRTERKGTPHTLICSKNDKSYHSAVKQRTADKKLLTTLNKLKN